jgi:aspartokinase/homoserine dehydrogenase 1
MNAMTATSVAPYEREQHPPRSTVRASLAIYKFGGASLVDGPAVRHAASLVADRRHAPTVAVASALGTVTDTLLALAHAAAHGATVTAEIARLRDRHLEVVDAVASADEAGALRLLVIDAFGDVEATADVLGDARRVCPRTLDRLLGQGEIAAAHIVAAALRSIGVRARAIDATSVVHTSSHHGHATPDVRRTRRAATSVLRPLLGDGIVAVVPGFIGRGVDGEIVTLGRGGSDLTATLLARVLDARHVVLWKDVPGILTADPRAVPDARLVTQVSTREAATLAACGARVLHPRALAPLTGRTRLSIRSFARPDNVGTRIATRVPVGAPVKAIAASGDQVLVSVFGRGFASVAELATRSYRALDSAGLASSLAGQTSSANALSFTLSDRDADVAAETLRLALSPEIEAGEIRMVRRRIATITVVGAGLATSPEPVTRTFAALGTAGIEVIASSQQPGEIALSVVVDALRVDDAQRVLHAAFQLDKLGGGRPSVNGRVDVVLLGVGAIGREILIQVGATRSSLRICGVIDTSGHVFDASGISRTRLVEIVAAKAAGRPLGSLSGAHRGSAGDAFAAICDHALARPVIVDATAAETGELLAAALERGWDLVLANKLPLAGDQELFDRLRSTAARRARHVLHEATVGAGLPVIDTLRKLQEAGDRVLRIEGCPSGTLGFLFGELGRGRPFSDALRRAVQAGYTEPDPRVDLSGADVARKALILARLIGFRGSLSDVRVESLIPDALREVSLGELLERLEELDESWQARVDDARARGRVLRYRARVTRRSIDVGLIAVATTDTLGALDGTDNQFAFTTIRYRDQPLVITGPGAGPAVTAAGVYTDLLRLAERGTR